MNLNRHRPELQTHGRSTWAGCRPAQSERRATLGDRVEENRGQEASTGRASRVGRADQGDIHAIAAGLLRERHVDAARSHEAPLLDGPDPKLCRVVDQCQRDGRDARRFSD